MGHRVQSARTLYFLTLSLNLLLRAADAVDACYNNSSEVDTWFNVTAINPKTKIKLGASNPVKPWLEGEHYAVQGQKVTLECQLPDGVPSGSGVVWTWQQNYVVNMRSPVVVNRDNDTFNNGPHDMTPPKNCTLAAYLVKDFKSIEVPVGLPEKCPPQKFGDITYNTTAANHLSISFSTSKLNQTATYQCSVIRMCDPGQSKPIAVTKSIYLKIYQRPSYSGSLSLAFTILGVLIVIVLVLALVAKKSNMFQKY